MVIGSGFSALSSATFLASNGHEVTILEKNSTPGGRARKFSAKGFTFDMGPSWYWMPDVFESYFNKFGKSSSDYYKLVRLDPSYKVIFGKDDYLDIPASLEAYKDMLESMESGSGDMLEKFLTQAAYKYQVGINQLVYKPGRSITEFLDLKLLIDIFRMDIFQSFEKHIRKFFSHEKILMLMEFPILFLGAIAKNTPALYSLMNYADIKLGTWYPMGGMYEIVAGMVKLATELGVEFRMNEPVTRISVRNGKVHEVHTASASYQTDVCVAGADYHHVENTLLDREFRNYDEDYWKSKVFAPSAVIFYLGVDKKIKNLRHHNLFFDADFSAHVEEIYKEPSWPDNPLFYTCAASKTDPTVAPANAENLFVLIPVATGLKESENILSAYYDIVINRMESFTGENIRDHVVYKECFSRKNFISSYNSYKGNAYGLANTLRQTAILKPSMKNRKIRNLYYTGQLTVPGPGVPPSLISGEVVANEIIKDSGH
ncbi:MAG: phytoene desaturase [Cyclobacteriaceae bacterium]|nr:phytoene desaturase [Cyclobacteriaceae bacterium]